MSFGMDRSPAGREIEYLEGDADTIKKHGRRIGRLGRQMISSADVLKDLATGGDDQRGKAIDKVREIVGETYEQLRRAGEMYEPTGPILVAYGTAIAELQPQIRVTVDACSSSWSDYQAAPGNRHGRWNMPSDETEAKAAEAEDEAKQDRYDDFLADARGYDDLYDTWETAFDTAVDGIGEVFDGGIKDGFWDNVDGFVAGTLKVLQVVGIVVAIAGIIIGGPIIAAIAAVASVLTLALTAYQYFRGDTGLSQLLIAIVGVIPFGSAGKLFQSGKRLEFLGDAFKAFKPKTWTDAAGEVGTITQLFGGAGGGWKGAWNAFSGVYKANNPASIGDAMSRLMLGKDTKALTEIAETMATGTSQLARRSATWEFGYQMLSGPWKLVDNIATWTGNSDSKLSSQFPLVGALL